LDIYRRTIEKAFGCEVFDYYGSREIGAIAAECEEHCGYHVSAENVVLEFVRDGEHVSAGENGVILVTSLRNFGMPFIRYAIEDVGKPSDDVCSCSRGLPLMASVEGRISQFMAVYDKRLKRIVPVSTAAPGPFGLVLMHVPLESYRIVQESLDRIVIVAVKGKGYTQMHSDYIVRQMQKLLGDNVTIEFKFVNYIPPLPSGKRSVFTSKINPFANDIANHPNYISNRERFFT
jgi:phenylacetate-CoA ligase